MFNALLLAANLALVSTPADAEILCRGHGPQTPRDLTSHIGVNTHVYNFAPPAMWLNLRNIHTHANAEHRGWKCNKTPNLTYHDLEDPYHGHGPFHGLKPGDTIEVH